jgi:hypothetical protein
MYLTVRAIASLCALNRCSSNLGHFSCRYIGDNENFVLVAGGHAATLRPTACSSASGSSQTR